MTRTVVTICGDPGGARALAPVVRELGLRSGVRVVSCTYNEATGIFGAETLPATVLGPDTDLAAVTSLLRVHDAAFVLAATSCNGTDLERVFIGAARRSGIPSMAVLDFWSGYSSRFRDGDGQQLLPDTVAVMDERARDEIGATGVPPGRVVVTGQPAFDALARQRQQFSPARREAIRRAMGAHGEDLLVLFASQPLAALYSATENDPRFLGYDEQEVAASVVSAVESARASSGRRIRLVIRCHPREDPHSFRRFEGPDIFVDSSALVDGREAVMAADLVVGMNSVLLLEACYLGCLVLSVQPGLKGPDMLPTNERRFSRAVYRSVDVAPALAAVLLDEDLKRDMRSRLASLQVEPDSARRVADCVVDAMGRPAAGVLS